MELESAMIECEETLSLSEVLLNRETSVTEIELWALCRECALTLEYVQGQPDVCNNLWITPDAVAFDQTGSVCFLDLGVEPDPFFIPPEHQEDGRFYKSQLFSLGMTMLYAVDYKEDDNRPEWSQKLNDLLSLLTADDQAQRPDLETVICQCEEALAGQSSQDVCLVLSTITPSPRPQGDGSSILDLTSGLTAYLQSQSTIVQESPPSSTLSPTNESHGDNRANAENPRDKIPYLDNNQNVNCVISVPTDTTCHTRTDSGRTEITSPGSMSGCISSVDAGVSTKQSQTSTETDCSGAKDSSVEFLKDLPMMSNMSSGKRHQKHNNSSVKTLDNSGSNGGGSSDPKVEGSIQNGRFSALENPSSTPNSSGVEDVQMPSSPAKESKKKRMTISDILDYINRYLKESELWALCREGILALQRKKKHLPAYISPDTVVVRGDGSITFKAIPEDKPLEVIFMAPELQQKGVLSEKTCLYGLGITLRCVAGQKYSTSLSLHVSQQFEKLLLALLQPSPDKRPSLQDTLQMCDNHEADGNSASKTTCVEMYQTAARLLAGETSKPEEVGHQSQPQTQYPHHPNPAAGDDDVVSEEELGLEYVVEDEQDLGYDMPQDKRSATDCNGLDHHDEESYVEEEEFQVPSPPPVHKPVSKPAAAKPSEPASSAFKPVVFKPGSQSGSDGHRIPSAFSSHATHFKPIVLQDASNVSRDKTKHGDCDSKENYKEKMKRLKELKQDLAGRKGEKDDSGGSGGASRKNKYVLKEEASEALTSSNPLESLLNQLQIQGQLPNTQTLASAIAKHLKGQTGPMQTAPETTPMVNLQQQMPPGQFQGIMNPGQPYSIPPTHPNASEHSFLFPMQYGSNMYSGYPPFTMQLQQDPRTGMMNWVPVMTYPSPPTSVPLGVSVPGLSPDAFRNGSSNHSQAMSSCSSDTHLNRRRSDPNVSQDEDSRFSPVINRGASSRGERDVPPLMKTVSPVNGSSYESNLLQKSNHSHLENSNQVPNRTKQPTHNLQGRLNNEARSSPHYRHFQTSMKSLSVPKHESDSPHNSSQHSSANQNVSPHRPANQNVSPHRLANQNRGTPDNGDSDASQTSSLSPSKDSGVSGVQLPPKSRLYPCTDASLMDRLLSPDNIHRQKIQGQVLQLVREEQGFDMLGYGQNTEDCAMAEYITSLAKLTYETFVNAIKEKYSQMYWGTQLIDKLYQIINSQPMEADTRPVSQNPPVPPTRTSSYIATENLRDRSEIRTQEWRERYHYRNSDPNGIPQHDKTNSTQPSPINPKARERKLSGRISKHDDLMVRKNDTLPNKFSPRRSDLQGQRPRSAVQPFVGSSAISETSDSTDTEHREKRRKYKKRYELDRTKSSSMHNLSSTGTYSVLDNRQLDLYAIPITSDFMTPGEMTPVNRGNQYIDMQLDTFNERFSDNSRQRDHTIDRNPNHSPAYSERAVRTSKRPDIHHSRSIQERYLDKSNQIPNRNSNSLSATPIQNFDPSSRMSSGKMEEYKFNSLPRDAFKKQTSTPSQNSVPIQKPTHSHQPVLNRKQEVSQQGVRNRDKSVVSLSNISAIEVVDGSDSETNFRNNVRRTSAKIMQQTNQDRNSYRGNGGVKEKVSQMKQSKQKNSLVKSLRGTNRSAVSDINSSDQMGQLYVKRGQVVYHWTGIQSNMSAVVTAFMEEVDQIEERKDLLEQRLKSVNQELTMNRKERKSSQKFYKKLMELTFKPEKGVEQKSSQVLKNLSEMTKKIRFLELCKTHLQMLLMELYGLDLSYLYSLQMVMDNKVLVLQPYTENPALQFQGVREPHSGCEVQVLHAGDPKGLMAYLFTSSALSVGYIHQFFFTYRYFLTPEQLFDFIRSRYVAACRASPPDGNIVRVMHRAVDLLYFWLEGFYSIDFHNNNTLVQRLEAYISEHVTSVDSDAGATLHHLIYLCKHGPIPELRGETIGKSDEGERSTCFVHLETSKKRTQAELIEEWDSFRSVTKVKLTPNHRPSLPDLSASVDNFRLVQGLSDTGAPSTFTRRADAFSILDFTPSVLAEQLTLMEQDLFVLTHPVHYLNSKAQGIGVSMSMPGMRTPSMQRKNREPDVGSLFASDRKIDSIIPRIIAYNQEVSHWVSAEIVTCTSTKTQAASLSLFMQVAMLCMEIHNFSTCLAILDGLENLIVRQLPTWKQLPSKCVGIMDELEKIKVQVKGEQNFLMKEKNSHLYPTIPSVLYFLLQVQQLELGNFKLANGMYKWGKMRTISHMIDQIRMFRENDYMFEPNEGLQDTIQQRIVDFSDQDLHTIASNNETNFRKLSGGGLTGVLKKVKDKFQSKGDK